MTRTTLAVAVLLSLAACKKPQPSAEFAEASSAYSSVTARMGDDAYADPEMARIEELLKQVAADSLDHQAAVDLQAQIAAERKRIAEEDAQRKADMDMLQNDDAPAPDPTPEPAPPPPADAQNPENASTQPQVGMDEATFMKSFVGCFVEGEVITLSNVGKRARSFALRSDPECAKKHPAFAAQLVLLADGKVIARVDKSRVTTVEVAVDAGQKPAPASADAGR